MYGGSDNVRTILVKKMNIVEFDDISIQFPGVMALKNVSFNIEKGEIMALCGVKFASVFVPN